jgi:hypothetical protein
VERADFLKERAEVAQIVRDGLQELRQHATANASDEFFATLGGHGTNA